MFTANVRTDDDIRAILRARVDTVYHPVGTCKMGVDDAHGRGRSEAEGARLDGLRVVDASIMPTLIGGNTNAPTIMIGEKAADMIREEMRAIDRVCFGALPLVRHPGCARMAQARNP